MSPRGRPNKLGFGPNASKVVAFRIGRDLFTEFERIAFDRNQKSADLLRTLVQAMVNGQIDPGESV